MPKAHLSSRIHSRYQRKDWARKQGILRLELTVVTHNQAAVALYQKRGFEIEGTMRYTMFIDEDYVDEHVMAKFLV